MYSCELSRCLFGGVVKESCERKVQLFWHFRGVVACFFFHLFSVCYARFDREVHFKLAADMMAVENNAPQGRTRPKTPRNPTQAAVSCLHVSLLQKLQSQSHRLHRTKVIYNIHITEAIVWVSGTSRRTFCKRPECSNMDLRGGIDASGESC